MTIDSVSSGTSGTLQTGLTIAHVNSGNLLTVGVSIRDTGSITVSSITYNGVALTKRGNHTVANLSVELWSLDSPAIGSYNIVVTLSGSARFTAGGTSFSNAGTGADISGITGSDGASTSPSVSVASASGEFVIDTLAAQGDDINFGPTAAVGAGQTELWNEVADGGLHTGSEEVRGTGSIESGATSVTMSWTLSNSENWCVLGASVKPSSSITAGGRLAPSIGMDSPAPAEASGQRSVWRRQTFEPDTFKDAAGNPAKGVQYHVLLVQGSRTGGLVGQSVIMLRDSHGQLDVINLACPSVDVPVLCKISCKDCVVGTSGASINLPPGFFRTTPITIIKECCPDS